MKRIEELDFTRIIAMIAVITIHVTSAFSLCGENSLVLPRRYTPIESRS